MTALLLLALSTLLVTVWWLSRPLRTPQASTAANEWADLTQLRDRLLTQLNELDAEQADKGIDPAVARDEELRLSAELATVLKRLESLTASGNELAPVVARSGTFALTSAVAGVMLAAGVGLYVWQNASYLQGFVLAAKSGVSNPGLPPQVFEMVAKLEKRLAAQPNDAEGWSRLGRSYVVLEQKEKALAAYAKAYELAPDNVAVLSDYAWLVFNENPAVTTGLVQSLYQRLAKLAPTHPDALWFLGFSAYQQGDFRKAVAQWERLLKLLPAQDPGRQHLQQAIDGARQKISR